jgi:Coenzyme PQQ synthesis protein D (PqqD)
VRNGESAAVQSNVRLVPSPQVLARATPRSVLLCTPAVPDPLVLRDTAVHVWQAFSEGATPASVASEMSQRFGVDEGEATCDLVGIVSTLCEAGALTQVS